jgi:WD40 repeat protein
MATFKGHNQSISSINFAPKFGNKIVSASSDNTMKIWDIKEIMDN